MVGPRIRRFSTLALGGIRLVNGVAALAAPRFVASRLGVADQPGTFYVLRLFGIRTTLLGLELLRQRGERLQHSTQVAPLIHASDTVAAAIGGLSGQLPPRAAILTTSISAANTMLAVLARGGRPAQPQQQPDAVAGTPAAFTARHQHRAEREYA